MRNANAHFRGLNCRRWTPFSPCPPLPPPNHCVHVQTSFCHRFSLCQGGQKEVLEAINEGRVVPPGRLMMVQVVAAQRAIAE